MRLQYPILALAFALTLPSSAGAALTTGPEATASFKAIGPAGLSIVGSTRDLTIREDAEATVTVTVVLGTLTTGIGLRDKHMREKYLEVQKYPVAVLTVPRQKLQVPADGAEGTFDADATLTLHGQTRPTRFRYSVKHQGKAFAVHGTMNVGMNDYGIETPKYLGVSVKPNVDVDVSFTAEDKI